MHGGQRRRRQVEKKEKDSMIDKVVFALARKEGPTEVYWFNRKWKMAPSKITSWTC